MPNTAGNYDFAVDPENLNSTYGLIIRQVSAGSRVLDVGCAGGNLSLALMQHKGCSVKGIDIDEDFVAAACANGVDAVVADLSRDPLRKVVGDATFDCVILADVLEHLADPDALLRQVSGVLAPGGRALVSLPNITHFDVALSLAADRWEYRPAGILDNTHLRFFDRTGLEAMAARCGFAVLQIEEVTLSPLSTEIWHDQPPVYPERMVQLARDIAELHNPHTAVYQYVAVLEPGGGEAAQPSRAIEDNLGIPDRLNVVVRTMPGRLPYLKDALYSIAALTYPDVAVILTVHSADLSFRAELAELLAHYEGLLSIRTLYLDDEMRKRGYPLNVALDAADGEFLCFLDDDDVLYPHFARVLIDNLKAKPHVTVAYGISMRCRGRVTDGGFAARTKEVGWAVPFDPVRIHWDNFIPNNAFVIRMRDVRRVRLRFDETLDVLEDWDFLRRVARWHDFSYDAVPVSEYRLRDGAAHSYSPETEAIWERIRTGLQTSPTYVPLRASQLTASYAETHREMERLRALAATREAELGAARAWGEDLERQLMRLEWSPVVRGYRLLRRTGLHVPFRGAWRLAARIRHGVRRRVAPRRG